MRWMISGDYDDSAEEEPDPQPVRHHRKSARPGPVVYVPVDDMEMPDQTTSRKKKSKKTNTQRTDQQNQSIRILNL